MIKYNNNTINDWNFGDDNIIKVYRNGAVCYYKITSGDTPTPVQEPCFAVVDDITQYQDTEFEDVFNKADNKWYKLNNLNAYEEYGVYGSGRTITYYDGKLTVDNGYEYIYSGGSWVNVGEVSGSSITIKSPEYIEKDSSHGGRINLDYVWKTNSKMQFKFYSTNNGGGSMIGDAVGPENNDCRMFFASTTAYFDWGSSRISWSSNGRPNTLYEYEYGNYYIKNMVTSASKTGSTISTSRTSPLYLGLGSSDRFRTYYLKFYDGDTLVKDFIPWTDMNGNYGLFDKVSLSVYNVVSGYGSLTGSSNVTDVEVGGGYEYPLEYVVREDPPDNLVFSSMAEAEAYECPWVGMHATINGDKYVFSGDSISGYEWVEQAYTQYEYIRTQNAATIYYDFVTNFKPTNNHTLEVKVEFVDRSIDWGHLVSWYDGTSSHQFSFQTVTAYYQAIVRTGGNNGVSYRPTIGANNPTVYTLPLSAQSGTYSTNGGSSQTIQYNYSTMTLPANTGMCFFGRGTTSREIAAVAKMYYVKVYDGNGNLVKHYVPSDNNGTPCFYEIVDGEYIMDTYTGSNHGTLTLGPQI